MQGDEHVQRTDDAAELGEAQRPEREDDDVKRRPDEGEQPRLPNFDAPPAEQQRSETAQSEASAARSDGDPDRPHYTSEMNPDDFDSDETTG